MTIEVAISGSTLIAVIILAAKLGSIQQQHKIMWRHFEKFIIEDEQERS